MLGTSTLALSAIASTASKPSLFVLNTKSTVSRNLNGLAVDTTTVLPFKIFWYLVYAPYATAVCGSIK